MKHIHIKFIFCALLTAPAVLPAGAQGLAENDSLNANELVHVAYRKVAPGNLLGGVSVINVEELTQKNYNTYSLDNMQGYVGGWNGNSLWGMSDRLILVDGVPRDANNILPTEIDQITFLKGASAVVLYGSRAAKGVISITTKRGKQAPFTVEVRANTGFNVVKSYPEYLGSAEYMALYNEARENDGLEALYSKADIYNYGSGENPYRYPNVNFYSSDYVKKAYNRSDVTAEISGGNRRARFYTNIGFNNTGDMFKFGEAKNNHASRLNVRGNVDLTLNESISAYVNANVSFYDSRGANGDSYWTVASTFRPNRVSPLIPLSYLDEHALAARDLLNNTSNIIDGKYFLGGTQSDLTNVFGNYYAAGYNKFTSRQFQFDAGVNIDLAKVLKGLSFQTQFSIDYATSYNTSYNNEYSTYAPTWSNYGGKEVIVGLTKYNNDKKSGVQNISGSTDNQTIAFSGQFNYQNTFATDHNVSAMLIASGYQQTYSGKYHRTSNVNMGLQLGYNYRNTYYADFGGAAIHSAKLAPGHRQAFSPSLTLGWRMSKENFLANSSVVDDLMLSVSGSVLHTDLGIDNYYMYEGIYNQSNGAWWGWRESVSLHSTNSTQGANKDLSFIKRKELAVNLKASLWNKMITADASFFVNSLEGQLITPSSLYPSYFFTYYPEASFMPNMNFNNDRRIGFDFKVDYNKRFGKVDFTAGVAGTYYTTKATKRSEINENQYQNRQGRPVDGLWGLQCLGFFQDDEEVAASPEQRFGGTVKKGDLKYVDQNGDNMIDDKDMVYLGKGGWYGDPLTLGLNLTAKWNKFTFFVLGTGSFGGNAMKNDSYHWVSGEKKYSDVVRGRWTEYTKETATYPRLTTGSGINNFQSSDFWMYKTDAIRLAKVQVTYDFPAQMFRKTFIHGLSAYVSGANLLTISKERKLLEMNVGSAPQTRFYNLGFKATF
ncbi:SusC/RagA family TonB-linked outer membrane protein [Bacteroides reticulotermitis]|nr:SusC/RagA family TonB-linked outer membrane protein [Bacteroides reticulotermitis]